jgi:hypothetical protein
MTARPTYTDPHALKLAYDTKIKSFEAQIAGLKSSVHGNDLTRTQRRLKYMDYRTDDPVVTWAKRRCKAMELTYADASEKLKTALESNNPSAAANALHHLERKVTVDDEFIRGARARVAEMTKERSDLLERCTEYMAARQPVKLTKLVEKWPFEPSDIGLNASRTYIEEYKNAVKQLRHAKTGGDAAALERALASWPYVEDNEFLEANIRLQKLQEPVAAPAATTVEPSGDTALATA